MRAMKSTFTSDKVSLQEILGDIEKGKIQLPDFQRGWIWDDEHIRELIESVSLSYPIGAIMLLETGGVGVRFKPRQIGGAPEPVEKPDYLILDGQQRLTSLYQSLFSINVAMTKDSRKKPIQRWYYINMNEALSKNGDRIEAIKSVPKDRKIKNFRGVVEFDYSSDDKEFGANLFPLNLVFESAKWRREYSKHWNHDGVKVELYDNFEDEVIDRFKSYMVPVIYVKKQTPKEAVCQVFEKVNTGGVSLTVFELLTASFAADNFSLREDWKLRRKRLREQKALLSIQSTDFLQVIALLITYEKRLKTIRDILPEESIPGVSCKRKEILRLTVNDYQEWADQVENGFLQAARFLRRQRIYTSRDLPYRTQVVPLAAAFAWLGKDAEPDGVQVKLSKWYWCGVLGELFGSAVESRFARDLPEIVDWVTQEGQVPKTVDDANFVQSRLFTLRTRNSAAYKGIHALLMRQGCLDFRTGQDVEEQLYFDDKIDVHHIFPKSWCNRNKIDSGLTDCIINKTPISARTNRIIGSNAPSVYLERLQKSAEIKPSRMNEIIVSHAINPESLRTDDFSNFVRKRENQLLILIEDAMGKPVIREKIDPEQEIEHDYEGMEEIEHLVV